jgi:hypothetical protein
VKDLGKFVLPRCARFNRQKTSLDDTKRIPTQFPMSQTVTTSAALLGDRVPALHQKSLICWVP